MLKLFSSEFQKLVELTYPYMGVSNVQSLLVKVNSIESAIGDAVAIQQEDYDVSYQQRMKAASEPVKQPTPNKSGPGIFS